AGVIERLAGRRRGVAFEDERGRQAGRRETLECCTTRDATTCHAEPPHTDADRSTLGIVSGLRLPTREKHRCPKPALHRKCCANAVQSAHTPPPATCSI